MTSKICLARVDEFQLSGRGKSFAIKLFFLAESSCNSRVEINFSIMHTKVPADQMLLFLSPEEACYIATDRT
jgi:hypothetical protein